MLGRVEAAAALAAAMLVCGAGGEGFEDARDVAIEVAHFADHGAHEFGLVRREGREGEGAFGLLDLGACVRSGPQRRGEGRGWEGWEDVRACCRALRAFGITWSVLGSRREKGDGEMGRWDSIVLVQMKRGTVWRG